MVSKVSLITDSKYYLYCHRLFLVVILLRKIAARVWGEMPWILTKAPSPTGIFYGLDRYMLPTILLTPTDATGALMMMRGSPRRILCIVKYICTPYSSGSTT
jgi:hypothetical protein